MEIAPLLHVTRGVTALIGGGGKTTLLYTLAEELRRRGTVIVTTSTHIQRPEQYPVLPEGGKDAVAAALSENGVVCVAGRSPEGKLSAPALSFELLSELADFVLVEADGSKRLPLKAHAPHEPVIPACAGQTVYVVGADGFGGLPPPGAVRRDMRRGPDRYRHSCHGGTGTAGGGLRRRMGLCQQGGDAPGPDQRRRAGRGAAGHGGGRQSPPPGISGLLGEKGRRKASFFLIVAQKCDNAEQTVLRNGE